MNVLDIARLSLRTLWQNKRLWLLGFFAAAGGGIAHEKHGAPSVAIAAVAAFAALVLFVISILTEAALIEGVRRAQTGQSGRLRELLRFGAGRFATLLTVRVVYVLATFATLAVAAGPALLSALLAKSVAAIVTGISVTLILVLLAVPVLLTLHLVFEWGMRSAVLERTGARAALETGARFLRGRLGPSLKLMLVDAFSQFASAVVGIVLAVPGLVIGGIVYLVTESVVPSVIVGGAVLVPFMAAVIGAHATFRSSLWTLGFLSQRPSLGV